MKKHLLAVAAATIISFASAGVCHAQQAVLAVNIPFEFQAGNQTLPPGDYRIETVRTGAGAMQRLRLVDSSASKVVMTLPVESKHGIPEPKLIFHRYGQTYFLSQIWTGESMGRQLFESNREKEISRWDANGELALVLPATAVMP
ncbi:MAG TPA: hypothetical protein VEG64_06660 [Candidatus Sulfotelmatobacter sp.]|nr:hypothetical protein [Candidatus Sulfotelmatobacter sp.]